MALYTPTETLHHRKRFLALGSMRCTQHRVVGQLKTMASMLYGFGIDGGIEIEHLEAFYTETEKMHEYLVRHGEVTDDAATYIAGIRQYIHDVNEAIGEHNDALLRAQFRAKGLHGMHAGGAAAIPVDDDAPACLVCCDAAPAGTRLGCCAQTETLCAGCVARLNRCPFCRSEYD